jgi:hypothetical protein
MSMSLLDELFVLSTRQTLTHQKPDGDLGSGAGSCLSILPWAICYSEKFPGNPLHKDPKLLEAIVRLGDFHCATGYGWDEWRTLTWLEAAARIESDLDATRRRAWQEKFLEAGRHAMGIIPELDHFDGFIPNHPVWEHVLLYRIGQRFGVEEFMAHAVAVLGRVMEAQTPDGAFREGGTAAGFPGSPVTLYSLVTAGAISAYHGYSGDPKAVVSLEKSWRWFYDFLLPDFSIPPTLDFRCPYRTSDELLHVFPSFLFNKPEGRFIASHALRRFREQFGRAAESERSILHRGLGFLSMQRDQIRDGIEERPPQWPEFHRLSADEACIRRRNGWVAVLSGLTNRFAASVAPQPFFGHERQDCLALYHETAGLVIGSSHSKLQPEASTFVFYENGRAQYLHDHACLRNPPPLDTLLLQYGSNAAAVSVDTTRREFCEITFSIHGERGQRTQRGPGHALSATAARAHLSLRLAGCERITHRGRSWEVNRADEERLCLSVGANEEVDFGRWRIACADGPWEFRWPVRLSEPYSVLSYTGERLGIAEVVLHPGRPVATFRVVV